MDQNGTNDVRLKARTPRTGASAMDHVMIVVALTLGASYRPAQTLTCSRYG